MNDAWDLIRNVTEVIGMIAVPVFGWILHTIIQHSKKLILLEERVNETISSKLETLEERIDKLSAKIGDTHEDINKISLEINNLNNINDMRERKLDSILEEIKRLSEK